MSECVAIIVAGGQGSRSGLDRPKQLWPLGGKPVIAWSRDALLAAPGLTHLVLVVPADAVESYGPLASDARVTLCAGGATRRESVAAGLAALREVDAQTAVLIHDAARPGLTAELIADLRARLSAGDCAGVIPVLPVDDTLVRREGDDGAGAVEDRSALLRVQTPQIFALGAIRAAHAAWDAAQGEPTDDAQMLRAAGGRIATIPGDRALMKLTYAADVPMLEAMLLSPAPSAAPRRIATGSGYDVHRLVPGKPLWLCGIEVAYSHGLSGHSDADVALHALTDALLGALAEGDIGSHFPPSDPQWRGAASWQFLDFAISRVAARGGRIAHLDVTIICEAPKVGPHREAMRARIAEIAQVPLDCVSVKATTTEGLGFTGRREGIAAQAVATIELPWPGETKARQEDLA